MPRVIPADMIGIRSSAMAPCPMPELEILCAGQSRSATLDEGLVYLVDRVKDMVSHGGENVYCVEVENASPGHRGLRGGGARRAR
jgi:hypothetical protein